jgi:hypothetical protein
MTLHEVATQEQFTEYYRSNNLQDIGDKIRYLTSAMKIRATRGDGKATPEETLSGLEEMALLGYWKALSV